MEKSSNKLVNLSVAFAVEILNLVKFLKSQHETIICNQIGRAGTSIGANIHEAQYAYGKADFVPKLQVFTANHLPNREQIEVGYDEAVAETARLTELRPELDEQEQRAINERLAYIADHIDEQPEVFIRYFVPDERKSGGEILEFNGIVRKIANGIIVTADGLNIGIKNITTFDIVAG